MNDIKKNKKGGGAASVLAASLHRARNANQDAQKPPLLQSDNQAGNIFGVPQAPVGVLQHTAPRLVNGSSNTTMMKVVYSDIGTLSPRALQIREPQSMLSLFDGEWYEKNKSRIPNLEAPCIVAEPGVTIDNLNATLVALGMFFHKRYPAIVDVLHHWFGIDDQHPIPVVQQFGGDKWIYVPETRFKPTAKAERYQLAREGVWVRDERHRLNRFYPQRLIDMLNQHTQTRSAEEARTEANQHLTTMKEETVVLASVIIALRARGLWVARQYFKKYNIPMEVSYAAVMDAIDHPDKHIDKMLGLDF